MGNHMLDIHDEIGYLEVARLDCPITKCMYAASPSAAPRPKINNKLNYNT